MASDAAADSLARLTELALGLAVDLDALEQFGPEAGRQVPQMRAAAGELRRYVRRLTAQLGEHDPVLHFARRVIADAERACDQLEAREVGSWRNREPSATSGEHYAAAMQDWREARRRDALQTEIEAAGAARAWRLVGTYMESCNCEVISPCRRVAGRAVGRPTYGACEGALSWAINHGSVGDVRLNGLAVVLAFAYDASELGSPWDFTLYLDERADERQQATLEAVFTGRLGGPPMTQFPWAFKASRRFATRSVPIEVDHLARHGWFRAGSYVSVSVGEPVSHPQPVSSPIVGHDRTGTERHGDHVRVVDAPLAFEHRERCAYQSTFDYLERHAA